MPHVLREQQYRILKRLSEMDGPVSRMTLASNMVSEKLPNGYATTGYIDRWIGARNPEKRAKEEENPLSGGSPGCPCPSLVTLGYVLEADAWVRDVLDTTIVITPEGIDALAEHEANVES